MKIQQNKRLNKVWLISVTLFVLIALSIASFIYLYKFNGHIFGWSPFSKESSSTINYSAPTEEEKKAGETAKQGSIEQQKDSPSNTKPGNEQSSDSTDLQAGGRIIITATNQSNKILQVRTLIEAVTNQGTCTLTLSRNGYAPFNQSVAIQALANSSTCKGFDISTANLTVGTWQLTVEYSDGTSKNNTTQDIIIE